jgi:hypothetical protein
MGFTKTGGDVDGYPVFTPKREVFKECGQTAVVSTYFIGGFDEKDESEERTPCPLH